MPFLPALPEDAAMLDVLQLVPETARPLVQFHEALMRGDSPLAVGQRELLAAYVSALNSCAYCHGVHAATCPSQKRNPARSLPSNLQNERIR